MVVDAVKLDGNRKRAFGMATKNWDADGAAEYHVVDVTGRIPEVKKGDTIILDA